jgi:hypothetical protein
MYQPAKYSWKNMQPTVYIMSNTKRGTLYIGVTSNLIQRVWQHKTGVTEGFTQRYGTKKLVYYEQHESMGFRDTNTMDSRLRGNDGGAGMTGRSKQLSR